MTTTLKIKMAVVDNGDGENAGEEITRLAHQLRLQEPTLTFAQARDRVLLARPDLAEEQYSPDTHGGSDANQTIGEEIVRLAEAERANDPQLSFAAARDIVLRANPTLAQQWVARGETE